ncbi:hypothetical protein FIBSPDRAFT_854659 [Athelia psychrophila]|uniref:Condensin complex subunit 2 n=1 Tax=Athelia psychrophila TaxID=1759441 RepID=A0A166Q025_9AGAM|nr:hypothetical protein FIBSPDRAFT_854659 [Fibularhizoctonia sp. CBS 109695]
MEEISTSFCFICLLHLANEQGLQLSNGAMAVQGVSMDADEVPSTDKQVGSLWDLKIYRDPLATPAA